jgi:hypothetical protein
MTSFLTSLSVWNWLDAGGFLFVLLGVALGFVIKRRKYRHPDDPNDLMPAPFTEKNWASKKERRENFWEYVLIIGLGLELAVLPHSIKVLEELHKANLELQTKLQPRSITLEQTTNFIFLTERIPKFPIRVVVGGNETLNYAWQIRRMLDSAKYPTPDSDTNLSFGVFLQPGAVYLPLETGYTNEWVNAEFISDNTNDFRIFNYFEMERTNGLVRYTINDGDTNDSYGALINAFQQIGITVTWHYKPDWVSPNRCGVFVVQKLQ